MVNKKKAQAFSADILVVVVIVLFGALFLVLNKISEEKNEDLQEKVKLASTQSTYIIDELKKKGIIDDDNNVDINLLMAEDLEQIRLDAGVSNEFAIVFEKEGNLVKIDPSNNVNCLGSDKIQVNGETCK